MDRRLRTFGMLSLCLLVAASGTLAPAARAQSGPAPSRAFDRLALPQSRTPLSATIRLGPAFDDAEPEPAHAAVMLDRQAIQQRLGNINWADARILRADTAAAPVAVTTAAPEVALHDGDILSVPSAKPAQSIASPEGGVLTSSSTTLVVVDNYRARELSLLYETSDLIWQPDRSAFVGTLLVGVFDRADRYAKDDLARPVTVQLLADAGALEPTRINVTHIGAPYETVDVHSDGSRDPLAVRLVSRMDPNLPPANLRLQRVKLAIGAPEQVAGLGLGSVPITITAVGSPLPKGQRIALRVDKGTLSVVTPVADDDGIATTTLRSDGIGLAHVSLVSGRFDAPAQTIQYVFPWSYFVWMLLGSVLGGFVFAYGLNRNKPKRQRKMLLDGAIGVIAGVAATFLAFSGTKLPQVIPLPGSLGNEAAAFAVAIVCGALGTFFFHLLVPKPATE